MGLDIYCHKVRKVRNSKDEPLESITFYSNLNDRRAKECFEKFSKGALKKLESVKDNHEEYDKEYRKVFKGMKKFTKYDFLYGKMLEHTFGVEDVKKFFDDFYKHIYAESDAYFRKVNFFYRYFSPKLESEACFATRDDIEELIRRCDEVLEDHDKAEKLLPTQSGFFFGSTDYDKWYFYDVRDVKRQMTKLLRNFNEDTDIIYILMSW